MLVGYTRVSTLDQNTVRQLDGVEVERMFTDHASGKDTDRPALEEMLGFVREGDTVRVHSMDRLARNLDDLRRLVRALTGKGVRVEFVKEALTFTGEDSPMATLLLSVMGAFAEFERSLILERQREGIAAAKARGVYTGRKPALTTEQADELRARAAAGESKTALAKAFRISRDTVYTYLQAGTPPPTDTQPLPDVAVHDQLPRQPSPAEPPTPPTSATTPTVPAPAHGRRPASRATQPKSRRERWLNPAVPVRELVTVTRVPDSSEYQVNDGEDYLGRITRQITATGRRGRWQALDPHNTILRTGPWNTLDEALTGLLAHHLGRRP